MLVVAAVLVLGAAIALTLLARPLIVVVPVPLAAPNPTVLPLIVPEPAEPGEKRIPL